jgi:flagellar protein FliO/FliZ
VDAALVLRAGVSLAVVLALAWLAARLARSSLRLKPQQQGALRLRATLALDARRRLHLVESDGGSVLILTGGATDCLLASAKPDAVP